MFRDSISKIALAAFAATLLSTSVNAEGVKRLTALEAMEAVMWGETPIGGSFSLTDHDGVRRTQADYAGKIMLVYFGFSFCPDICPADLMAIGGALNALGEDVDQVQALFVSLDPVRDRPHLKDYVTTFHPTLIGLVGTEDEIAATASHYSIYYQKMDGGAPDAYTIDHSAYTFLYDQKGTYRGYFPPGSTSDQIAAAIRPLLVR